ncbi:hypothetical protein BJX76DRAFT_363815 [Aspergillus varians]
MDLPPEIRNQIYSYIFLPQRVQIHRYQDPRIRNHYRLYHKQLSARDPSTQKQAFFPYNNKRFQTQLSLPFVSKQSYQDTLCLLYACTQFVFPSPKVISRFLEKAPKQAQAAIEHIELHHTMYNEPSLLRFREVKLRSDKSWYLLCERISLTFTALSVVHVDLKVFDAPIELEVGESWSLPILALRGAKARAARGEGRLGVLRFARVKLKSHRFECEKIRDVERKLERELMDPVAMQIREDERLARELAGVTKASKVLRLVFD